MGRVFSFIVSGLSCPLSMCVNGMDTSLGGFSHLAGRGWKKRDSISELAVGSHVPRLLLASSFLIFPSLPLSFSL